MSLESFVISDRKEAIKDYEGHIKRNEETTWKGSYWVKVKNQIINMDKNYNGPKHTKQV